MAGNLFQSLWMICWPKVIFVIGIMTLLPTPQIILAGSPAKTTKISDLNFSDYFFICNYFHFKEEKKFYGQPDRRIMRGVKST